MTLTAARNELKRIFHEIETKLVADINSAFEAAKTSHALDAD